MSEIVNRVANSSLVTIDLEELYSRDKIVLFDLKPFLFQELILKEKDFRASLKQLDWSEYNDKLVAVTCTADAVVPSWAFMLVGTYLKGIAYDFVLGDKFEAERSLVDHVIDEIDVEDLRDRPVIIKGCSQLPHSLYAQGELLSKVMPYARSVMYGEPCSTVPLYKKPKA
ncbi:DUF2480 family protein [Algoriphagus sediminis]|uniref:DUF2480 family protein n=1 Tax=Algoriphagus sediminis TaxID=3057113 RepID=A0ABT7YG77_9BACT|nr:DUF2480 family protein [Algoriphagus sediminis]MDN3205483.1 DUF2480 family protein [Algoriphagus sediminis]